MSKKIEPINNHEGIKIMCLVLGIIGIVFLLVSIFTIPLFTVVSIVLLVLGIIFSAIYKSKAGLILNIVGISLLPIIIVGIVIIKIFYFNTFSTKKSTEKSSESNYQNSQITNTKSNFEDESSEIIKKFNKYFNSKTEKVIYYARSNCSYCKMQTPILEQIAKENNIDYLDIDTDELTNEEVETITKELNIEGATPTTVVVKNGNVISTQIGYIDGEKMLEFLKKANVISKTAQYKEENSLTNINYIEYKEIINKKGKNIIVIGQTGCGHCTSVKPKLNAIIDEYNIIINYLNLTDLNYTDRNNIITSLGEIGYDEENYVQTGSFGTPLTLILEDGKVISYVLGDQDQSEFIKAFKSTNIINN